VTRVYGFPRHSTGEVVEFDGEVGLGTILADAGVSGVRRPLPFHCTQISDGSRSVAVGTRVSFSALPARLGRWEAFDVTPI
jgi:hypothetical protein